MRDIILEESLPAQQCPRCKEIWIQSNPYLAWLKSHGPNLPEENVTNGNLSSWETKELKLCPDCGRILSRLKVLSKPQLYLAHCGHCNGVWFDKDEWKILVDRNLHDDLNSFFTKPWQAHIHEE